MHLLKCPRLLSYSGIALNFAVYFLPLLPPPPPSRLFLLNPTSPISPTLEDGEFTLLSYENRRLFFRLQPHFSPPLLASAELALTANAAISSAWSRCFNRFKGRAKYNCPGWSSSSSLIAEITSSKSISSELQIKHEGFLCKTYETLTGYEYSCNLPSCKINFAVATFVESQELHIPIAARKIYLLREIFRRSELT